MRTFSAIILAFMLFIYGEIAPAQQNLDAVLQQMDEASTKFKSAEADFVWENYQKVVDEKESQSGKIYFRRNGKNTDMGAVVQKPDQKFLTVADGKLRFYQPRIEQLTERDISNNRSEFESFLVLGFGGSGSDLRKQFDVKLLGNELIDGVNTAKLELIPKQDKVKQFFDRIVMWIDPVRAISLRQQAFESSGDYRLANYTNIKLNQNVPASAFKIKTTGKTKVVRP